MKKIISTVTIVLLLVCFGLVACKNPAPSEPPSPELYNLTFAAGTEADASAITTQAVAGMKVTLPSNTFEKAEHEFAGWTYDGKTYNTGDKFDMPSHDVTFVASWTYVEPEPEPEPGDTELDPNNPPDGVLDILICGNSLVFWHDLDVMLYNLGYNAGKSLNVQRIARGSATMGEFATPSTDVGSQLTTSLAMQSWDIIIFEPSRRMTPWENTCVESELAAARLLKARADENGAKMMFYATWGVKKGTISCYTAQSMSSYVSNGTNYITHQEQSLFMKQSCDLIAEEVGDIEVIDAGYAFENAMEQDPDLNLYDTDLQHPSVEGHYLVAATFYAAIYGETPVGNTYTAGTQKTAFLQQVAHDTVLEGLVPELEEKDPENAYKILMLGSDIMNNQGVIDVLPKVIGEAEDRPVVVQFLKSSSFVFNMMKDPTKDYGLRTALDSKEWDAIILQLTRRCTPTAADVEASELAALKAIWPILTEETENIFLFTLLSSANPAKFTVGTDPNYTKTGGTDSCSQEEGTSYYDRVAMDWKDEVGIEPILFGTARIQSGYSDDASLGYLAACMIYNKLFNKALGDDATELNGLDAQAAKKVRDVAYALTLGDGIIPEPENAFRLLVIGSSYMKNHDSVSVFGKMLAQGEGKELISKLVLNSSFVFNELTDPATDYGLREALEEREWDAIILQLTRRVTPNSPLVEQSEDAALRAIWPLLTKETENIYIFTLDSDANPSKFTVSDTNPGYVRDGTDTCTAQEGTDYYKRLVLGWQEALGAKPILYGNAFLQKPEITGTAIGYLRACMIYMALFGTEIPTEVTELNGVDATLAAQLREIAADVALPKFTASFAAGDGTGNAPTVAAVREGKTIVLPDNTFVRAEYTFAGWVLNGTTYQPGAEYVMTDENVTFTASWTALPKHAITFVAGDGATGDAPTLEDAPQGRVITLPQNPFTNEGFTFEGWSYGGKIYAEGAEFTMPDEEVTFTASWTQIPLYAVTFAANGGEGTAPILPQAKEGDKIILPANPFIKTDYAFEGWSYGGSTYEAGAEFTMPAVAVEFVAVWKEIEKFAITFAAGGGAGEAPVLANAAEGAVIQLPENPFTYEKHVFTGWSYDGKTYEAGAEFTMPAVAVEFVAVWKETLNILILGNSNMNNGALDTLLATMIDQGEEKIATVEFVTSSSFVFKAAFDGSTSIGKNVKTALDKGGWDIIILQLTRRMSETADDVEAAELAALKAKWAELTAITTDIYLFTLDGDANPSVFKDDGAAAYTKTNETEQSTMEERSDYFRRTAYAWEKEVGTEPILYGTAYSKAYNKSTEINTPFDTAEKIYLRAIMIYMAIFDKDIPAEVTTINGIDATFAEMLREYAKEIMFAEPVTVTFGKGAEDVTGDAPAQQSVREGEAFALPQSALVREGFTFDGWSDGSKTYREGETLVMGASAIEFVAVWKEIPAEPVSTFAVTFVAGGGAGEAPTMEAREEGAVIQLPENPFTYEKHAFTGWSYGGTVYAAGAEFTMPGEAVEFVAVWKETYHLLVIGSDLMGNASTMSVTETLLEQAENKDVTIEYVQSSDFVFNAMINESTAVGASAKAALEKGGWDAIILQLTRRMTEAADDVEASELAALKTFVNANQGTPIYVFALNGAGSPTIFQADGSTNYLKTSGKDSTTAEETTNYFRRTIYAWEDEVGIKPILFGNAYLLTSLATAENGYLRACMIYMSLFDKEVPAIEFVNGLAADRAAELREIGKSVVFSERFAVTFAAGAEGVTGAAPTLGETKAEGEAFVLPQNTFERTGFTFEGWSDGKETYEAGETLVMGKGAVEFVAVWKEIPAGPVPTFAVTFEAGEGSVEGEDPTVAAQEEGAKVVLPQNPYTKNDHVFAGWSYGGTVYAAGTEFTMPGAAVAFVASWQEELDILFLGSALVDDEGMDVPLAKLLSQGKNMALNIRFVTDTSFVFRALQYEDSDYGMRVALAEDEWDVIALQLTRRVTESATDVAAAEKDALTEILPLLRQETDDIVLYMLNGSSKASIFTVDETNTTNYTSTGTKETSAADAATEFYVELINEWGEELGIKTAEYGPTYMAMTSTERKVNANCAYLQACVMYMTIFNEKLPDTVTDTNGIDAAFAATLRGYAEEACFPTAA